MHTNPSHSSGSLRPITQVGSLALLALATLMCGCPSFATRGSARTLADGEVELSTGLGATSANPLSGPTLQEGDAYPYSGDDAYPTLEVGLGYGLTDRVELGGRLMVGYVNIWEPMVMPAFVADTKIQLARASASGEGLDVALDPTLGMTYIPDSDFDETFTYLQLPVLIGMNLSERRQLVLSPNLTFAMPHLGFNSKMIIPSVGVAYLHRFESGWGLRPELTAIAPCDGDGRPLRRVTFQAGFSLLKK